MSVRAVPPSRHPSDLVAVCAAGVLLGASLLTWYTVDLQFFGQTIGTRSYNGWQAPDRSLSTLGLLAALAAGAAALVLVVRGSELSATSRAATRAAQVLLAALSAAALGAKFLDHRDTAAPGVYVALVVALVLVAASALGLVGELERRGAAS